MTNPLTSLFGDLLALPRRFPGALIASACATLAAMAGVHDILKPEIATQLAMACIFAFPVFVAAALLDEATGRLKWVWQGIALVAAIAVGMGIDGSMEWEWPFVRWVLLTMAATMLAGAIPALSKDASQTTWWRLNVQTIEAAVIGTAFAIVAFIGLALALASLKVLFDLSVEDGYLSAFFLCGMGIGPVVMLAGIPLLDHEEASPLSLRIWGMLVKWLLIPLGLLYVGILGIYAVQILIQGKLPTNMVGLPVLVLGAYGTAAMLLLSPWRDASGWTAWFARIYPAAYLALSILLFIAFGTRIASYGITVDRYLGLAAGIWFGLCALAFLLAPGRAGAIVGLLFAGFALVSAAGPLSAGSASIKSQTARIKAMLADFQQGNASVENQLASDLRQLTRAFGQPAAKAVFGSIPSEKQDPSTLEATVLEMAGLTPSSPTEPEEFSHDGPFTLPSGDTLWLQTQSYSPVEIGDPAGPVTIGVLDGNLAARRGSKTLHTFPLPVAAAENSEAPSFDWNLGTRRFHIVVTEARWAGQPAVIVSARVIIVERNARP